MPIMGEVGLNSVLLGLQAGYSPEHHREGKCGSLHSVTFMVSLCHFCSKPGVECKIGHKIQTLRISTSALSLTTNPGFSDCLLAA
jgi:hypothetical protein